MALIQHSPALSPEDLATSIVINSDTTRYIIFYASVDPSTGKSWCGDCRDAEPLIEAKFKEDGKDVIVVAVGERLIWRTPENVWRKEPFSIEKLPTLLKVTGDKWERLVEEDVYDHNKLDAFLGF